MKRARLIVLCALLSAVYLLAGCESSALPAGHEELRSRPTAIEDEERWTLVHLLRERYGSSDELNVQLWVASMQELDRDRLERAHGVTPPAPLEGCEYVPATFAAPHEERVRFLEAGVVRLRSEQGDRVMRARSVGSFSDALSGVRYATSFDTRPASLRLAVSEPSIFQPFAQRLDVPDAARFVAINGEAVGSSSTWYAGPGEVTLQFDASTPASLWVRDADEPGAGALVCALAGDTLTLDDELLATIESSASSPLDLTLVVRHESALSPMSGSEGVVIGESRARLRLER